jgi:hypothetical protein
MVLDVIHSSIRLMTWTRVALAQTWLKAKDPTIRLPGRDGGVTRPKLYLYIRVTVSKLPFILGFNFVFDKAVNLAIFSSASHIIVFVSHLLKRMETLT